MDNQNESMSSTAYDMQQMLDRLMALEEKLTSQDRLIASLKSGEQHLPIASLPQVTKRRNLLKVAGATVAAVAATTFLTKTPSVLADTTTSHFVLLDTPHRLLDTRGNSAPFDNGVARMIPGQVLALDAKVVIPSPISTVSGIAGNLTVTNTQDFGFLTVYAKGANPPNASSLNFDMPQQTVCNFVFTRVNTVTGGMAFVISSAPGGTQADVIFDVTGYFTA